SIDTLYCLPRRISDIGILVLQKGSERLESTLIAYFSKAFRRPHLNIWIFVSQRRNEGPHRSGTDSHQGIGCSPSNSLALVLEILEEELHLIYTTRVAQSANFTYCLGSFFTHNLIFVVHILD